MPWLIGLANFILIVIKKPHHNSAMNFCNSIIEMGFFIIHSLTVVLTIEKVDAI